jgi:hypothetical protein
MTNEVRRTWRSKTTLLKGTAFAAAAIALAAPAVASHSWGGYHWARAAGAQITAPVGDNVTSQWDSYLRTAVADWNKSTVIEGTVVTGMTTPRRCSPVAGRIEVCNAAYGQNGWLGIASIWLSNGHISQGTTKLNDTYYAMAQYNTPAWRAAVTCQEIGHDYGLGHQDEDFSTDATTSCMEYTSVPAGNEHPDAHDYDQLLAIYNHAESATAVAGSRTAPSGAASGDSPADWGTAIGKDAAGRPNRFMHREGSLTKITHVTWAPGHVEDGHTH